MAFSSIAKNLNRSNILQSMKDFSIYTKQDISRKTGLSFPTTSKIVDELVSEDILHTLCEKRNNTGGRKAYEYQLDKEYAYSLCIVIEPHKLKALLTNMDFERKHSIEKTMDSDLTMQSIQSFVQEQLDYCPKIKSIAIGVPGAVHKGKILLIDGFEQLQNCKLQDMIYNTFHVPTIVLNNMNALISGLGRKYPDCRSEEDIACIHIGEKGAGCSFLVNGAPVSGFRGFQGEVGFNPYDQTRTFREIALDDYRKVEMEAYIGRLAIQIITVLNPSQLMIYLPENRIETDIREYCLRYLPKEVLPQILYLHSYEEDYITGLMNVGIKQIFAALS